ncbi:msx2-interacting protein-like [Protopterus annectens]|uniref:msx2-interacting protein-like n=1 Tax=Protopterus annectens TaxID=7888 RepID=UPI001CFB100B|nr:msx2-interacting protein-like [Protopterus annectens]
MLSIPGLGRYSGSVILPPPDSGSERALPQPVDINLTLQKWRDASELGSSWGAGSATGSYQKGPEESSAGRSVIPGNPSVIPGNPSDIYRFESRSRELRLSEWPPLDKKLSLWEREVPSLERAIVRDYSGEYRHENRETSLLHRETSHRSGTSVGVSHLESAESYLREARMAGILSRDTGTSLGIGTGVGIPRLESAEAYSREARILDILSRDSTSHGSVARSRRKSADSHSREARKSRSRHGSGTTSRRKSAESHSREARRSRDSRSRRRSVARSRRKSADSRSREARRSRDSRSRRRSRSLSRRKSAESHSREPRRSRSRHGSGTRSRRKSAESHSREVRKTRAVDTDLRTEEKLRVSHQDPVTTRTADSKARSLHHESKQSTHLSSGRSASKHSSGSTSEIRYGAVGSSERVNSQPDSFGILAEGLSTQSADSSTRLALFVAFKRFGKIIDVQIHGSGESRYGLVFFRHQYSQETALEVMQGKDFFGTSLKLLPWTLPVPEKEENEPLPNQDVTVDKPGASRYLLAHGMDPRTRAEHMQKLFQEFGEILDIKIEESEGRTEYVIVEYADIASVCKAINEVDWYKGLRLSFKPSKPTVCIWMGDLPRSITEEYLMQISKLHGQVSEVILNNVKGEALVEFQSAEDAEKAIQAVRKENILEQKVVVSIAFECFLSQPNSAFVTCALKNLCAFKSRLSIDTQLIIVFIENFLYYTKLQKKNDPGDACVKRSLCQ